jgi:hypothetical protein
LSLGRSRLPGLAIGVVFHLDGTLDLPAAGEGAGDALAQGIILLDPDPNPTDPGQAVQPCKIAEQGVQHDPFSHVVPFRANRNFRWEPQNGEPSHTKAVTVLRQERTWEMGANASGRHLPHKRDVPATII